MEGYIYLSEVEYSAQANLTPLKPSMAQKETNKTQWLNIGGFLAEILITKMS